MGFQLQAAPLLSTALVFLSWGWLQWKSSQYNSIGDELDVELETLQRLTVEQLTKGDAPAKRREPESEDEVASRVETLKIFALGGVALLMVPVFFLSMADPMAPPSPELAARLAAELS